MPVIETRSVFSGIPVSEAMRRQVVSLPCTTNIGQGIRTMIRYKSNAVLITDQGVPCGVASKTDLLGAFYVQLPITTPLGEVMGSQPIACFPDDMVEDALEIMDAAGVHRLYVTGADRETVIGAVAYSDIVGLLYRYCRSCERGIAKKRAGLGTARSLRLSVREVMTREVYACRDDDPLLGVIETLSTRQMGAVLIRDADGRPAGVISKTDLVMAYRRGVPPETPAREIMNAPIRAVAAGAFLASAIQEMLIGDVQRLFVYDDPSDPDRITGVLALSDAARFRSGSCRACTAGRMLTGR